MRKPCIFFLFNYICLVYNRQDESIWRKEYEGKIIRSRSRTGRSGTYDIKGSALIKENDIIAVPGAEVRETVAYKIAVQAVPELADKELLPIYMPMTHDKAELELNHEKEPRRWKQHLIQVRM